MRPDSQVELPTGPPGAPQGPQSTRWSNALDARIRPSERIRRRIESLLDEADGAVRQNDWGTVRARAEAALVGQHAFGALKAPVTMVTAPHTPVPFAASLEDLYMPNAANIEAAVRAVFGYAG